MSVPVTPTLAELAGDPHPHLARLRTSAPVVWVPALGGYLVVARAAAVEVLRDSTTFTVDDPRFATARVVGPSMLSLDGSEHGRHRAPFAGPFRPGRVGPSYGAVVEAHARRRVDAVASRSPPRAELRSTVAGPVAAAVAAASLGLDDDDASIGRLLGWYRDIAASVAGLGAGRDVTAHGARAMRELAGVVEATLARPAPSLLHAARDRLTDAEITSNAAVLLFGGIETTEAMILNALWYLLGGDRGDRRRPPPRPDPDDTAAVAAAVEESLRLEPAAAVVDRYATVTTALHGVEIPAGSLVVVSLAAANRDPAEFAEPDRYDPARPNVRRQLAFASGPHVCLGQDLARLETVATVAGLLRRLPGLDLAPGAPPPTGLVFRKPARLDVTWRAS